MATIYEERYNYHPDDFKSYDTTRIRKEFLVEKLMEDGYGKVSLFMLLNVILWVGQFRLTAIWNWKQLIR